MISWRIGLSSYFCLCLSVLIGGASLISAANVTDSGATAQVPQLMQAFSVESTPGKGSLIFKASEKKQTIALGKATGFYGFGMVFDGSALPNGVPAIYRKSHIIQLAFGTLPKKLTKDKLAQFAAVTVLAGKLPTSRTTFKLSVPTGKENPLEPMALMMFAPPWSSVKEDDEEKLKNTFFGNSGKLTYDPQAQPQATVIQTQGQKLEYWSQIVKVQIEAALITPFNPKANDLGGTVLIPVYWPKGASAISFMREMAKRSLASSAPVAQKSDNEKSTK